MLMTILVPALVLAVGLGLYVGPFNPKVNEIGRLMFFAGLLVPTYVLAEKQIKI